MTFPFITSISNGKIGKIKTLERPLTWANRKLTERLYLWYDGLVGLQIKSESLIWTSSKKVLLFIYFY